MYQVGAILHGLFDFYSQGKKTKYAIILYKDKDDLILTTFTTSKDRSGTGNPAHGANPTKADPKSYVFKAKVEIGLKPDGSPFSFNKDTTIVPDYGLSLKSIAEFNSKVEKLEKVCQLNQAEYIELIYVLYKSKKTSIQNKTFFSKVLEDLLSNNIC